MAVVTGTAAQTLNQAPTALEAVAKNLGEINKRIRQFIDSLNEGLEIRKRLEDSEFNHLKFKTEQTWKLQNFELDSARKGIEYAEALFKKNTLAIEKTKQLLDLESQVYSVREKAAKSVVKYYEGLNSLIEPLSKISSIASQFGRDIAVTREAVISLRNDALSLVNAGNFQQRYNATTEDLLKITGSLTKALGRQVTQTGGQYEDLVALRSVFGDEKAVELVSKMSVFGKDTEKAAGMASKMFANANKYGISLERYSKNFLNNMKIAQSLTFERGLEGLRRMAETASEINLSMQETAKVAEKFTTLEDAMTASAQLSVLGGNFTAFSNPLAMMNEAFNDAESLQNRLINMFSSLASWDSVKGEISMSGYNRQRLRVASGALGLDPNEMFNMVFEKARRDRLLPEVSGLGFNNDISKLLLNIAQLDENGRGYVTHKGEKYSLSELGNLSESELEELLVRNSSDSDNIKTIAESLMSIRDTVEGYVKRYQDFYAQEMISREDEIVQSAISSGKDQTLIRQSVQQSASAALESINLEKRRALFEDDSLAKTLAFRKRQIEMQQSLGEISYLQSKYMYEVDLPIQKQRLLLDLVQDKRSDEMYRLNRINTQLMAYSSMISMGNSLPGFLKVIGTVGAIAAGAGGLIMTALNTVSDVKGVTDGLRTGLESRWNAMTSYDSLLDGYDKSAIRGHWDKVKVRFDKDVFNDSVPTNGNGSFNRMTGGKALNGTVAGNANFGISRTDISNVGTDNLRGYDRNPSDLVVKADGGIVRGRSHANGGVNVNMEGGEYIIPKSQVPYYATTLDRIRNGSYPKDALGGGQVNLNVGGTIRLELNGSSANVDARELLNDPVFMRKLAYEITRSSEDRNNFGVNANSRLFGV